MNTRMPALCLSAAAALCLASCATGNADTITAARLARIDRMVNQGKQPSGPAIVYTVEDIRPTKDGFGVESSEIILRDRRNPGNPTLRVPYNAHNNALPFTPYAGQNVTLYLDNREGEIQALFP